MRNLVIFLAMLLVPSCTQVVEEWVPSNPMDVAVHVSPGSVITARDGTTVRIESDAVLFPSDAFMHVIHVYQEALQVIEEASEIEQPADDAFGQDM